MHRFSLVQSLSHVWFFVTPWTAVHQVSLSTMNSQSLLKLVSIELVMPSNHPILHCPLLLLPSIFPSIRVFSNKSVLHIRWPKYCSFSFSISPSNEYSGLISQGWTDWISLRSTYTQVLFASKPYRTRQSAISWVCGYRETEYEEPQICIWHHPYGRKLRRTK